MTRVGLALPQLGEHVTAEALQTFCERAEALGFASLWVQEHLFYPHQPKSGYAGRPGLVSPDAYRSMLAPTETLACAAGEFFSIPASDVRPKPLQSPHPPLLSGLWSRASLQRTVELFDIWNPARGTPAELRTRVDQLNAGRAQPLALYFRSFAQRPSDAPGTPAAGKAWAEVPDRLAVVI